ncbi:MAG: hypothetical protein ABI567_01525 [Gammaproteobacteria bacterium]
MSRPPETALETITANCRPQPAIPAVLVLMLCGLLARSAAQAGGDSLVAWALTAGLVVSCGLAIAAGFCSLFPTLAWMGLAWLLLRGGESLALHGQVAFWAGMVAAAGMTLLQVWRVRTRRFVPTIADGPSPDGD